MRQAVIHRLLHNTTLRHTRGEHRRRRTAHASFMLVLRAVAKLPVAGSHIAASRLMRSTPCRNLTISSETKRLIGTRYEKRILRRRRKDG